MLLQLVLRQRVLGARRDRVGFSTSRRPYDFDDDTVEGDLVSVPTAK